MATVDHRVWQQVVGIPTVGRRRGQAELLQDSHRGVLPGPSLEAFSSLLILFCPSLHSLILLITYKSKENK